VIEVDVPIGSTDTTINYWHSRDQRLGRELARQLVANCNDDVLIGLYEELGWCVREIEGVDQL